MNKLAEVTDATATGFSCQQLLPLAAEGPATANLPHSSVSGEKKGCAASLGWPHLHPTEPQVPGQRCPPKCQQKRDLFFPGRHSGIHLVQLPFRKPETFHFGGKAQFDLTPANKP